MKESPEKLSDVEIAKRRDELAKRILRTPPEPQKRLGESKKKPTGKKKIAKGGRDETNR